METFITFIFWWSILGVVVRSIFLLNDHPRIVKNSTEADAFGLIVGIALLAWVAVLKYGH